MIFGRSKCDSLKFWRAGNRHYASVKWQVYSASHLSTFTGWQRAVPCLLCGSPAQFVLTLRTSPIGSKSERQGRKTNRSNRNTSCAVAVVKTNLFKVLKEAARGHLSNEKRG